MLYPEMNPYTYGQLSTTKVSKYIMEKRQALQQVVLVKRKATFKIVRSEYSLIPHAK